MNNLEIIPQLVGAVALVLSVSAFQINKRKQILGLMASANLFWAIHFYLLGAYTGSAMNGLAIFRNYLFIKYRNNYPGYKLPALFIIIFLIATVLTWQGPVSLLAFGGMATGTIAFWQKSPKMIRLISLLAPPMWFLHNFIKESYPGMIIEVFVFCSILIAIYRYDILGRSEPLAKKAR